MRATASVVIWLVPTGMQTDERLASFIRKFLDVTIYINSAFSVTPKQNFTPWFNRIVGWLPQRTRTRKLYRQRPSKILQLNVWIKIKPLPKIRQDWKCYEKSLVRGTEICPLWLYASLNRRCRLPHSILPPLAQIGRLVEHDNHQAETLVCECQSVFTAGLGLNSAKLTSPKKY